MAELTCDVCGRGYPAGLPNCPGCGSEVPVVPRPATAPRARISPGGSHREVGGTWPRRDDGDGAGPPAGRRHAAGGDVPRFPRANGYFEAGAAFPSGGEVAGGDHPTGGWVAGEAYPGGEGHPAAERFPTADGHRAARPPAPAPVTHAELDFPWGPVRIGAGERFIVGRETPSMIPYMGGYPNVSRRHAEVAVADGGVFVIDASSTNGTFVNGDRLEPGEPCRVGDGDVVRFAAHLWATVRLPDGSPTTG